MFKKLMNKKLLKNQKGLTLIELLAVIVILAIVAAIAVPAIGNIIENSRYNAVKADAINVLNAANLYFTDTPNKTTVNVSDLKKGKYLDTAGKFEDSESIMTNYIITKGTNGPNKLGASSVKFSGDKTVTFIDSTITTINKDDTKGSSIDSSKTIQ